MRKVVAAVLLAVVVFALYRKAVRLWWTYDDPYQIHIAVVHPAAHYVTDTSFWRTTAGHMFVPLLLGTYEAELAAFALEASRWYAVQLILLFGAALALYATLRQWVPPWTALAGAVLFAAGPPLCTLATQIMDVHYLECVILGCLAVLLFERFPVLSAVFYFLAMLAKEIAVPLPLVLVFLRPHVGQALQLAHRPEGGPSDRGQAGELVLHHFLALALYLAWRFVMLGTLGGGYGWAVEGRDLPKLIAMLPWKVLAACAGAGLAAGLAMLAVMLIGALPVLRRHWALALFALALAIAPILPVSTEMQRRYALGAWVVLCVLFALGRPRAVVAVLAIALALVANRLEWKSQYMAARRMSDEARTFFDLPGEAALRSPLIPPGSMPEFRWLKEEHLHRAPGTTVFYDDLYLCKTIPASVYSYTGHGVQPANGAALAQSFCPAIRHAPLTAAFRHRGESLFWTFGPYANGEYSVVIADGLQAFRVPREGGFQLPGVTALSLRVKYQAPEGWVTYSPEVPLQWQR